MDPSSNTELKQLNMSRINSIDDLQNRESHFNWLPVDQLTEERQEKLLEKIISWLNDIVDVEVPALTIVSQHFLKFVFESLSQRTKDAEITMQTLEYQIELNLKNNLSDEALKVLDYMIICEKANFWFLLSDMEKAKQYVEKMKLAHSEALLSSKSLSIVLALKGLMFGHVGNTQVRVELFREAVKFDPTSSDLHQYLYSSLRRLRRENWNQIPTDEEIEACQQSYDMLELKTSTVLLRMATLFEELINASMKSGTVFLAVKEMTREEMKETLVWFVRKAVELNPNSISTQVKYGDILANGVARNDELAEAQYKFCLEKWPVHSQVLHKAGKFYALNKKQVSYGLELLGRGLESDIDNFPCLMDFLRYKSKHNPVSWTSIVSILDKFIANFTNKPIYKCRLLQTKGCVLWTTENKRAEAVLCWVEAIEVDPEALERKLLEQMSAGSIFQFDINFEDVLQEIGETIPEGTPRHLVAQKLASTIKTALKKKERQWMPRRDTRRVQVSDNYNWRNPNRPTEYGRNRTDSRENAGRPTEANSRNESSNLGWRRNTFQTQTDQQDNQSTWRNERRPPRQGWERYDPSKANQKRHESDGDWRQKQGITNSFASLNMNDKNHTDSGLGNIDKNSSSTPRSP